MKKSRHHIKQMLKTLWQNRTGSWSDRLDELTRSFSRQEQVVDLDWGSDYETDWLLEYDSGRQRSSGELDQEIGDYERLHHGSFTPKFRG